MTRDEQDAIRKDIDKIATKIQIVYDNITECRPQLESCVMINHILVDLEMIKARIV